MKDPLGDRIKSRYEDAYRLSVPGHTYAIVRIDGKAFHTFTKGLERPFCPELSGAMDAAAEALCKEMMGCRLAYGQSDEYSFLFTDFDRPESEMWFSGNLQKIASVSASIFTAHFNEAWRTVCPLPRTNLALFDSRVFIVPPREDVAQYFIWRQVDAIRNSLNMVASCNFPHKELQGKGTTDKHEMLHSKGINFNSFPVHHRRGRVIRKVAQPRTVTYTHKKTKQEKTEHIEENKWTVDLNIPAFTRDKKYLDAIIPQHDPKN